MDMIIIMKLIITILTTIMHIDIDVDFGFSTVYFVKTKHKRKLISASISYPAYLQI